MITQSLLPLLTKTAQEPKADVRIIFVRNSRSAIDMFVNPHPCQVGSGAHNLFRAKDKNIQFKTLEDFSVDFSKDWFPVFARYCGL